MPSAKVNEFLEHAERYREMKERVGDKHTRDLLEQMENSYRALATSQARLEQSKKHVEALDKRKQ